VDYYGTKYILDDEDGTGWAKVTEGYGGPRWPHSELPEASEIITEPINDEPDVECVHGMGDPAWCTICNGRESRERAELARAVHSISARRYGHCQKCHDEIEVGDTITLLGDGRWVCEGCAA